MHRERQPGAGPHQQQVAAAGFVEGKPGAVGQAHVDQRAHRQRGDASRDAFAGPQQVALTSPVGGVVRGAAVQLAQAYGFGIRHEYGLSETDI